MVKPNLNVLLKITGAKTCTVVFYTSEIISCLAICSRNQGKVHIHPSYIQCINLPEKTKRRNDDVCGF